MDVEAKILLLEKRADDNDEVHKDILKRLNAKDVSDAVIRQQLDTLVKTTSRIEEKVDDQQAKPAKRWEVAITAIITTLIGGIVGAIIGLIIK